MRVLFVNHTQPVCGVYQFGKRLYELASKSELTEYRYIETDSKEAFRNAIEEFKPDIILYNWYPVTMSWLSEAMITSDKAHKHFFVFHDGHMRQNFDKYIFSGSLGKDIYIAEEKTEIVPRPLFIYDGDYKKNDVTTIGSFGFGSRQKGFDRLIRTVNDEFDEAIINIQMPFAYFGDRYGNETRKIADECRKLHSNPKIQLNIDHTFLSNEDTLKFLAGNDINVFLYQSVNQGLSSVIDYALSVRRPVAISNDSMFKHIYSDDICLDGKSITEILNKGTKYSNSLYRKWNPKLFHKEMDKIYG